MNSEEELALDGELSPPMANGEVVFEAPWQSFWRFCESDRFLARANELEGYDVSALGAVHANGP